MRQSKGKRNKASEQIEADISFLEGADSSASVVQKGMPAARTFTDGFFKVPGLKFTENSAIDSQIDRRQHRTLQEKSVNFQTGLNYMKLQKFDESDMSQESRSSIHAKVVLKQQFMSPSPEMRYSAEQIIFSHRTAEPVEEVFMTNQRGSPDSFGDLEADFSIENTPIYDEKGDFNFEEIVNSNREIVNYNEHRFQEDFNERVSSFAAELSEDKQCERPDTNTANRALNSVGRIDKDLDDDSLPDETLRMTPINFNFVDTIRQLRQQSKEKAFLEEIMDEKIDVDPTPDLVEGIFVLERTSFFDTCQKYNPASPPKKKIVVYDRRSMYCCRDKSRFRQATIRLTHSNTFESFVVFIIFLNSLVLAMTDYGDRDNLTDYNKTLETISTVFSYIFTLEFILKAIAMGFVKHNKSYLRDPWNCLDFLVVLSGLTEIFAGNKGGGSVRALRVLRVLRPLKSINAFPKMRRLIGALLQSLPMLGNAVLFMMFIFLLFGILGVQQFGSSMYQRCRFTDAPNDDGTWPIDMDIPFLCSKDAMGYQCPSDRFCHGPLDGNMSVEIDNISNDELIDYGITVFDNLGIGFITVFQMITLEGWTKIMYNMMDCNIAWMGIIFSILLIIIGSFFLLNVILAILAEALNKVDEIEKKQQAKQDRAIFMSLKRRELQDQEHQKVDPMAKRSAILTHLDALRAIENSTALEAGEKVQPPSDFELKKDQAIDTKRDFNHSKSGKLGIIEISVLLSQSQRDQDNKTRLTPQLDADQNNISKDASPGLKSINNESVIFRHCETPLPQIGEVSQESIAINSASEDPIDNEVKPDFDDDKPESNTATKLPERATRNIVYKFFFYVCTHWSFTTIITLLIILNTIALAMESYPVNVERKRVADIMNETFSWCFLAEMIIKLIGLGFKDYTRDAFNIFDACLVIISLIDYIILQVPQLNVSSGGALSAFRGVRLLRVFKLARSWTSFRILLKQIVFTIREVSYFLVLLFITMFIFALLGMELYGSRVRFAEDGTVLQGIEGEVSEAPRPNFDNFYMAMTSIFIIFIGEDWHVLMHSHYRAKGNSALFFFPFLFICLNLIQLNLFLAILLQNFEEGHKANLEKKPEANKEATTQKLKRKALNSVKKICLCCTSDKITPQLPSNLNENEPDVIGDLNNVAVAQNDGTILNELVIDKSSFDKDSARPDALLIAANNDDNDRTTAKKNQTKNNVSILSEDSAIINDAEDEDKKKALKVQAVPSETHDLVMLQRQKTLLKPTRANMSIAALKKLDFLDEEGKQKKINIMLIGRSCMIFGPKNLLRRFCKAIVEFSYYDTIVMSLIFISTILLTLDNPLNDKEGELSKVLGLLDYILTFAFTLECAINIVLLGLLFNGTTSYLKDSWNILDFLIVVFSLVNVAAAGVDLGIIKLFRMLRVLRPLRVLKRNLGLKIQVISLLNSIPGIMNLLAITMLLLMLFGIQGVNFFAGKLYDCNKENMPGEVHSLVKTQWDCYDYGGEWVTTPSGFDNVGQAMTTMFTMMTTEGWTNIMWQVIDATEIHQVPTLDNKPIYIIFCSLFLFLGSLFILNLFVGVVISTFNHEKDELSNKKLLTELQQEYLEVMLNVYKANPERTFTLTGNRVNDVCRKISNSECFSNLILGCIILNTVCLSVTWYGEPDLLTSIMEIVNIAFTIVYTIEMIIKLVAYKTKYFLDGWNNFDFLIVFFAWFGFVAQYVFGINVGALTTVVRAFRILRVLKLIRKAPSLQKIVNTFMLAIPELINVGALLFLFLFLFAVLGVSLFSEIKLQENLNSHANFQHFGIALLTLFRITTGEGWHEIMYDCAKQNDILFSCTEKQTFEERERDGINGCGTFIAYPYFMSFTLMVSLIFLNLFIAIILEGQLQATQQQDARVTESTRQSFIKVWTKYDNEASGFLKVDDLPDLILDLAKEEYLTIRSQIIKRPQVMFNFTKYPSIKVLMKLRRNMPLSKDEEFVKNNQSVQNLLEWEFKRIIIGLAMPLYNGLSNYNFHDTLTAFVKQLFSEQHRRDFGERVKRIEYAVTNDTFQMLPFEDRIKIEGTEWFNLDIMDQEKVLEANQPDFQKVIDRLEGKGKDDRMILQLNNVRTMRVKTGQKSKDQMDLDHTGKDVLDSSHLIGAQRIETFLIERRQRQRMLAELRIQRGKGIFETKKPDNQMSPMLPTLVQSGRSSIVTPLISNFPENLKIRSDRLMQEQESIEPTPMSAFIRGQNMEQNYFQPTSQEETPKATARLRADKKFMKQGKNSQSSKQQPPSRSGIIAATFQTHQVDSVDILSILNSQKNATNSVGHSSQFSKIEKELNQLGMKDDDDIDIVGSLVLESAEIDARNKRNTDAKNTI